MTITRPHPSHFGKSGKPKVGEFKATCRTGAYLPTDALTAEERDWAAAEDARQRETGEYLSVYRWDKRLKVETVRVECSLDTTDRAEYLAHTERVHGRKPATWAASKVTDNGRLSAATRRPWKAPKLTENGTAWKHERTETCACGLVAEVGELNADRLWWDEHLRFCTERGAA